MAERFIRNRRRCLCLLRGDRPPPQRRRDLSYAYQLCPGTLIVDGGGIAADAPTGTLLAYTGLLREHRSELPFGVFPPPPSAVDPLATFDG